MVTGEVGPQSRKPADKFGNGSEKQVLNIEKQLSRETKRA